MFRFRLILTLVLSLMLPIFGSVAAAASFAEPCPMPLMSHDGSAMSHAPCCNDMQHGTVSKSPCKSGEECKIGGLVRILNIGTFSSLPPLPLTLPTPTVLQSEPADLWRPPRYV
ncbi:hypothetical protein ACW9IK_07380 [Pseudomonas gingeri]|uniref:Uncharacterized protein n=1 Tax=Pseudomonas gingeri TaxID=117681 RepID=A0A7Y8CB30_9PSED|nr:MULTISPECIES: hypothetical protein [Pseudomonas]NVZ61962.1 hypothetical protein [Pseudomonas gingeri]NVZ73962.1 hypothetical protein [Pseudomonas gingeri]NWA09145.1 hypothetical protein [Pseudomonas gingeri]NWC12299.1 hypothetical protein [Pseudomonas gingeri]NWE47648.1 hypothetical protein [Pseudomonas gingeri]